MGYATRYKISTKVKPLSQEELDRIANLEKQAQEMPDGELKEIALKGIEIQKKKTKVDPYRVISSVAGFNPFDDSCSWYEHDKHMRQVSLANKGAIFILQGEGEDPGDIWKKYYLDGKCQETRAIINFDEFDESKLV
jgi:hypothetical protein